MEEQSFGRGLDALLNRHKDNKKRVDTLKLYKDSVHQAMSDGLFTQDEQEMLEHLGNSLGVPEEEQDIIIGEVLHETGAVEGEKGVLEPLPPSPSQGYGAMKSQSDGESSSAAANSALIAKVEGELRNTKIERDALAEEIKLLKEEEALLQKQIDEMGEKIMNRNKEMKILRMENDNLKKEFMGM